MTGYWDIHNHILPGVDDGSSCMRETMSLLQAEYEQGIRHLIVTPHYRRGMFEIGFEDIQKVYEKTRLYCEETFPSMHLYLGRECFVSSVNRAEKILSDSRYYMAGRPVVLLEFGYETEYAMIFQTVLMAQEAQVIPVLAHIERYRALQNQDAVRRIRKAGASVQIISQLKNLMWNGFLIAFLVGLAVNQITDLIGYWKGSVSLSSLMPTLIITVILVAICMGLYFYNMIKETVDIYKKIKK